MNVTIEVTRADIDAGVRGNCVRCPVALAARRALPQFPRLAVGAFHLWPHGTLKGSRVALPDAVWRFIDAFDAGDAVAPFAFSVDVPDGLPGGGR